MGLSKLGNGLLFAGRKSHQRPFRPISLSSKASADAMAALAEPDPDLDVERGIIWGQEPQMTE